MARWYYSFPSDWPNQHLLYAYLAKSRGKVSQTTFIQRGWRQSFWEKGQGVGRYINLVDAA